MSELGDALKGAETVQDEVEVCLDVIREAMGYISPSDEYGNGFFALGWLVGILKTNNLLPKEKEEKE